MSEKHVLNVCTYMYFKRKFMYYLKLIEKFIFEMNAM